MTKIRISPGHRSITWDPSRSLMDQLLENGIYLDNACSGRGLCGKCRIRVVSGEGTPVTGEEEKLLSREELDSGIRLACMMEPVTDLELETVGGEKKGKVLTGGYIPEFQRAPLTRMMPLTVERQTVEQQTPFEDVLMEKTGAVRVDANALMGGSRAPGEYTAVIREGCVVDIVPGHQTKYYGAAVDIGTTTVVCSLVDMETGEILADASEINAQKTFGLDVLSRITYEMEHPEEGAGKLQRAIVESMNAMIGEVCRETGVRRESIREITVAANCTMLHLLLGVDARPVGTAPFAPVFTGSRNLLASDIGLKAGERAALYCLPSVSAYIGADIVAGAYVCDLQHRKGNVLFIDIGTNGEIVLASGGRLLSCSCAAGPALEGMNISCGMRAADGAIEDVVITADGEVERKVIGDEAPCGICGSGILTVTRELIRTGIVRKTGAFAKADAFDEEDHRRKLIEVGEDGKRSFRLLDGERSLRITQGDVRQVQLAKGAILSGFMALLNRAGIGMEDLDEVLIAGQFGAHLPADSLTGVGILPKGVEDRMRYVGNSSRTGAYMALLSGVCRRDMEELAHHMEYVELGATEGYERLFSDCLIFPGESGGRREHRNRRERRERRECRERRERSTLRGGGREGSEGSCEDRKESR